MVPCYPLLFQPMLYPKVWGGDRLSRYGKPVKPGDRIGESWELADMAATSASGAGGGAARSIIENGPLAGRTLRDAIAVWGHRLLGPSHPLSAGGIGEFPLLIKFLDAREDLSIQVHPSPEYAAHHPGAHLKTECWYILDALPGAKIYKGTRPGVTRALFAAHIADGTVPRDLEAVDAIPGECHVLPSGTVHALGAGVLVAEVQTPSDTTFRVFDWGRTGRQLHIEQALACIHWGPAPPATRVHAGSITTRLVSTPYFTLDECRPTHGQPLQASVQARATVLIVLEGQADLRFGPDRHGMPLADHERPLPLRPGRTVLIPAEISERTHLIAHGACRVLRVGVGADIAP
jgi:mannose-6-phosphate isomerase